MSHECFQINCILNLIGGDICLQTLAKWICVGVKSIRPSLNQVPLMRQNYFYSLNPKQTFVFLRISLECCFATIQVLPWNGILFSISELWGVFFKERDWQICQKFFEIKLNIHFLKFSHHDVRAIFNFLSYKTYESTYMQCKVYGWLTFLKIRLILGIFQSRDLSIFCSFMPPPDWDVWKFNVFSAEIWVGYETERSAVNHPIYLKAKYCACDDLLYFNSKIINYLYYLLWIVTATLQLPHNINMTILYFYLYILRVYKI